MSEPAMHTDFPNSSRAAWQAIVESGLRGEAFETLAHHTEDGIRRGPLMSAADLPPHLSALGRTDLPLLEGRAWHIAAPVRDPDLAHANAQVLDDLKGGASAIRIESGMSLGDRNDLKRLLEGVYTDLVPIQFVPDSDNVVKLDMARSIKGLQTAHIGLGLDPSRDEALISDALKNVPDSWKLMGLAPSFIHEHGGTNVQELSGMAASLSEAMRRHGAPVVCRHLVIELAADRDAHLTIAKFRAARRLVLRIADAFGTDGSSIPLHAVTSQRMMQTIDAWSNLLRVLSAGFGAVLGGADVVTTRPFTDGLGHATPFAHRIARNMQVLMMEESHLGQVSDPAHGSYWHERMTDDLAQAAWRSFQIIERDGGIEAYLESGTVGTAMDAANTARAKREEPVLGVTLHPADGVKAPEVRGEAL